MKIFFSETFNESDYANDCAAEPGRIETIVSSLHEEKSFSFAVPETASEFDIHRAHTPDYLQQMKDRPKQFHMALLAAGAAICAAESALQNEPAFACIRPPGHHASRSSSWGYCVFCNMAVALLKLKAKGLINSAFILDFDAHTGDGTIDILSDWKEAIILNPYREDREQYLEEIKENLDKIKTVDIVGICAGFDTYIKDVGRKLSTFDFYQIGFMMKKFSERAANGRRFAILEGGYYLPDLGKNVLAFCQGFA